MPVSRSATKQARNKASLGSDERKRDGLCQRCREIVSTICPTSRIPKDYRSNLIYKQSLQPSRCQLCTIFKTMIDEKCKCGPARWCNCYVFYAPKDLGYAQVYSNERSKSMNPNQILALKTSTDERKLPKMERLVRAWEIVPEKIDYGLIKKWLSTCQVKHTTTCGEQPTQGLSCLKVIDCKTREIKPASPGQPYVALSYLWGDKPMEEQPIPGRLAKQAPATIEDAMRVSIELGIPFLWIDRYCINQADKEETHHLIARMDQIYSGAEVTIIAAAGPGPEFGLPGVSTRPREPQKTIHLGRHNYICMTHPTAEKGRCNWWTRGWTFQEMLLSRRRLVFNLSQTYFQCLSMCCMEALDLPDSFPVYPMNSWAFPERGIDSDAKSIYRRLEEYSRTRLTYEEDVLNAFSGIFNAFRNRKNSPESVRQFWGIPLFTSNQEGSNSETASFVQGLAWEHWSERTQRREGAWPSWTWAARKGGILDYNVTGSIFQCQDTLTVRVIHRRGLDMDLAAYATQEEDYDSFHPWIDLSSYAYSIGSYDFQERSAKSSGYVKLEDLTWGDLTGGIDLIVSYLGVALKDGLDPLVYFLLLREREDGCFERVGLCYFPEESACGKDRILKEYLPVELFQLFQDESSTSRWKHRTLRIV